MSETKTIAVIGGTGKEGKGLAYRWAKAGYQVVIGSRLAEKAEQAAAEVAEMSGGECAVRGLDNLSAAALADIVVLTVPYAVHQDMLAALKDHVQGKIFIDVTVPLVPPKVTKVQLPPAGSAAQEAQAVLGAEVQVVSAFQNISYEHLMHDSEEVHCDVLVCGNSKAAKAQVLELVHAAGLRGYDAGPIDNSVVAEGLTSILIGINKQFGVQSAGIQITGLPKV